VDFLSLLFTFTKLFILEIMERFLKKDSSDNALRIVWDPFMGTGTTGVICGIFGTKFIGTEMDVDCFDIAYNRIRDSYVNSGKLGSS